MKRLFFASFVAIAMMTTLVSCDKDTYLAAPSQPFFFRIVDATHVNFYDQQGILCEEGKETEFKINTQFPQNVYGTKPLEPAEGETMSHHLVYGGEEYDTERTSDASILVDFNYNYFCNSMRVYGLYMESTDALGNKVQLVCLDKLVLKATIETLEMREEPFFQHAEIHYTLYADTTELTSAVQDVRVVTNADDVDF